MMTEMRLHSVHSALSAYADETDPLTSSDMAACLPRDVGASFAIAVSGGPDSMALAILAAGYAQETKRTVHAFTVDHKLRPTSGMEALQTKVWLTAHGIPCDILVWRHGPVGSGIPEAARGARYELLADACLKYGLYDLLVAHHLDDQRETVMMRLAQGSGPLGLAGMQPIVHKHGVRLIRPLLTIPRQRLLATCDAHKQNYHRDPTNADPRYLRGRVRLALAGNPEAWGKDPLEIAEEAQLARATLTHKIGAFLKDHAQLDESGMMTIERAAWAKLPPLLQAQSLRTALRTTGSETYGPSEEALQGLINRALAKPAVQATLHGCWVSVSEKRLYVMREPGMALERKPVKPFTPQRWDDRFIVSVNDAALAGTEIRALGNPPHASLDLIAPGLRQRFPQGRTRAALPAFWAGERLLAVPTLNAQKAPRLSAIFYRVVTA